MLEFLKLEMVSWTFLQKIMLEYRDFSIYTRYIWYNFNWEICYALMEFVFRITAI